MKCLVVGYGSIGQRHARILTQLACRVAVVSQREIEFPLVYPDLASALTREQPDYIVIASQTSQHHHGLSVLADYGFKGIVLVEKPLFDKIREIPNNAFEQAYVGYNLRFHPVLQKIYELITKERASFTQVYVGQYLPDWRPERDYRMSYSANKNEGGGVLLDLSHEIDYLLWLFEDWRKLTAMGGKYSSLQISSDDIFCLMLSMKKCPVVQIQLNYLDRIGRREITVITENYTVKADLVQQTLQINEQLLDFSLDRDYTYLMQHQAILNGTTGSVCTLAEGLRVLETLKIAEQAAKLRIWVGK